jgi:predicted TIM-barrel fold metal-dependent hydrolase
VIIDTHTHIVANDEERYPLTPRNLSGDWYRKTPHTDIEFLHCMDVAGVAKAVLVQPVGAYSYDNTYTADSAAATPSRFASACCIDMQGKDPVRELEYWIRERGMHGVRFFALAASGDSWLDDERTFPVWERATELGAHVIVTIFSQQFPQLARVLRRFPTTRVSLDHCGFPSLTGPPFDEAQPLFELAALGNLYCKVSTIVLDAASREGADPCAFVEQLTRAFGANHVMWGSDFCQTHDRDYLQLVALARSAFSSLSADDRTWCLAGTAMKMWPSLQVKAT